VTEKQREFVVGQLRASEALLAEVARGLAPEQARYREAPERWSIAEVLEHLVVWESFMLDAVQGALQRPAEPEKRAEAAGKEPLVLGLASSRDRKLKAREAAQPAGRWSDVGEMLAEFRARRAKTVAFAQSTQADLQSHFFKHIVFGDLDCYQWLVAMGQHTLRHVAQIEEIRRAAGFPYGDGRD
jgi:hypothetical protein